MSDYGRISKSIVKAIADALRFCNGNEAQYTPGQMPNAVRLLKKRLTQKTITQNGTYIPPSNYDGFDRVTVNVEGSSGDAVLVSKNITANGNYSPSDDNADGYSSVSVAVPGAVLQTKTATANGTVTPDSGYDGMSSVTVAVPNTYSSADNGKVVSGGQLVAQTARAAAITQNGTYDTTENNSVTVNVNGGGGGGAVVQPLSVTQNGTYNPPSGVDGFSPVTVNVSGGGGEDWLSLKNYIESSGTQYINTGYSPTANTKFEVIADVPDNTTSYPALIGERTSTSNEVVIYSEFGGGNLGLVWANGDGVATKDDIRQYYIGNKCKYVLSGDGLRSVLNANGYGFLSVKAVGTFATLPIFIFALNDNGTPNSITYCSAKLYRFRIYEGDTLVHEYLPWQENGVACLKDTVTSNLLYNAGTGDFVYGTDA